MVSSLLSGSEGKLVPDFADSASYYINALNWFYSEIQSHKISVILKADIFRVTLQTIRRKTADLNYKT